MNDQSFFRSIESERRSSFCFNAFSSREPAQRSTSLENALGANGQFCWLTGVASRSEK
jgi:hypothetical protein